MVKACARSTTNVNPSHILQPLTVWEIVLQLTSLTSAFATERATETPPSDSDFALAEATLPGALLLAFELDLDEAPFWAMHVPAT